MEREKSCGAIVFSNDGELKFLIIKHRKELGNHWDWPKGHVEEGETEEETATREVFEETGIKISIIKGFRKQLSYTMSNGIRKDVIYFISQPINTKININTNELQDAKWAIYDEAFKILTFDNSRELLKKAHEFISNSH